MRAFDTLAISTNQFGKARICSVADVPRAGDRELIIGRSRRQEFD
jgi:hypothetical protein